MEELDPSHRRIHPRHRLSPVARPKPSSSRTESVSSASDVSDAQDPSDDAYGAIPKRQMRYSTRNSRLHKRRKSGETEDEDFYDVSESDEEVLRRSGRTGIRKNYKVDGDYKIDEETDDDAIEIDSDASSEWGKGKQNQKPKKRKAPKPAYGRIRDMDDLDGYDSLLLRHRDECEKCNRPAASLLLQKLKSRGGRKKKKSEDDFSENDEDFFTSLGGWVRWLVSHLQCLGTSC